MGEGGGGVGGGGGGRRAGCLPTVNVDIFACIHFAILRKLAISRGLKLALLILKPLCGII